MNLNLFRYVSVCLTLMIVVFIGGVNGAQLIWDESFSDNSHAWFEDGSRMHVTSGQYEFYSEGNDAYSWRSTPFDDGVIEVDTQWVMGRDTHGYGLIFRLQDSGHFYFFWLAAQGYYVVGRADDGQVSLLQKWTYSPLIVPHGKNRIRVVMRGDVFTGYVNGTELFTVMDDAYPEGGFGFYAQQQVHAAFDNLTVWETAAEKPQQRIPDIGLIGHWSGREDLIGGNDIRLAGGARGDDETFSLEADRRQWALLDPSGYNLDGQYTISFDVRFNSWANDGSHADNQYLLEWTNDVPYDLRSYIMRLQIVGDHDYTSSAHDLAAGAGRASQYFRSGVTPSLDTWYRLTLILDNGHLRLYLDEKKILDRPYSGGIPSSDKDIVIGRHMHPSSSIGYYSDVDIGMLYLYDRPLAEDEVISLVRSSQNEISVEPELLSPPSPQTPASVSSEQTIPERFTLFGTYNAHGNFGGSVYLKDIFNKEAYPAYLAFFPLKRVRGVHGSKDLDDYEVTGAVVYYTATDTNGFYRLDLPDGEYLGVVYNDEGYPWDLVTGETAVRVSRTLKVHHFKIDNTREPTRTQPVSTITVQGTVRDGKQSVAHIPVRVYTISSIDEQVITFTDETVSDYQGAFTFMLPPDAIYLLKAGVSEQQWLNGEGRHGGTILDLGLPLEEDVTILLEQL
ncbi:MAG: hypothetical protein JXK93_02595 [Sphaerochaetaceae bacterium]|nr:hypothetical protein [Sphaerochaetaceae bacterium]